MDQSKEVSWMEILRPAPFTIRPAKSHKCECGNGNCKHAKRIRCECGCGGTGHGSENRIGMEPLDKPLGLDGLTVTKESPKPLGDLALNLDLSGRSELEGAI